MILKNGEVLMRWPLDQHVVTQGWHYNSGASHNGIDLRTQIGNTSVRPVYAAAEGDVCAVQLWDGHTRDERSMQSYGNRVDIRHADYKKQSLVRTSVQVHRRQGPARPRGAADRLQRGHRQRVRRAPAL